MMKRLTVASRILVALAIAFSLLAGASSRAGRAAAGPEAAGLADAIDDLLTHAFKPDLPGAAVIVVKDGAVVFRKGYGMASLELGVPVRPDMVFRLGSITKQFTAVAILMLAEQGKLSVADDITRFLPDFPTQGHKITIENLLTHTSGIKNYTSLPEWLPLWRKDMSLTELTALFKDKPLDFAPGERWSYSNSGYILLGAIIEKASGQSYKDFVEKQIFAPLGMTHSFYDMPDRLIPGRVQGYSKGKDGFVNCAYLSMTQPYAAGSLASSVDDLALWDAALYTEKLLKQESLRRAWTSFKLNNGKLTHYGYGWGDGSFEGRRLIAHNGGIHGFATSGLRFPEDKVYVAVLSNQDSGEPSPDDLALKVAGLAIGKPYKEPTPIDLPASALDRCAGAYKLDGGPQVNVVKEGDKLTLTLGRKMELLPLSDSEFFVKGSMNRIIFVKDATGAVTGLVLRTPQGIEIEAAKVTKPAPAPGATT